eukprot:scaffold2648_cov268-Chaetoceros_neogracile.AAC.6
MRTNQNEHRVVPLSGRSCVMCASYNHRKPLAIGTIATAMNSTVKILLCKRTENREPGTWRHTGCCLLPVAVLTYDILLCITGHSTYPAATQNETLTNPFNIQSCF